MQKSIFKEHIANVIRTLPNKDVSLNAWIAEFTQALKSIKNLKKVNPVAFQ